jgi:hypothetical protein
MTLIVLTVPLLTVVLAAGRLEQREAQILICRTRMVVMEPHNRQAVAVGTTTPTARRDYPERWELAETEPWPHVVAGEVVATTEVEVGPTQVRAAAPAMSRLQLSLSWLRSQACGLGTVPST